MKTFICIAGLPLEAAEQVRALPPASLTGDGSNLPIIRSISSPFCYRPGMADAYLHALEGKVRDLTPRSEATVLLVYVNYEGRATQQFVRSFYPFALVAPVCPFYPDAFPRHLRRRELKIYVEKLKAVVAELRQRARVVRDELSGNNFNPLLLPLRNFYSDILQQQIIHLYENLGTIADPRAALSAAKKVILQRHPLNRLEGKASHTPYFQDDRSLIFKSPGKNRHGMARQLGIGHQAACLIGARARLGGPYDALFHYDCEYLRGGVDREYPNCHGCNDAPAAATHVNIAPNDAIR